MLYFYTLASTYHKLTSPVKMADAEKAMDVESGQNEAHEGDIPSDEEGGKVNCQTNSPFLIRHIASVGEGLNFNKNFKIKQM